MKLFFAVIGLVVWSLSAAPAALAHAPAPDSFADLAEERLPAVVNISTSQIIEEHANTNRNDIPPGFRDFFDDFFNQQPEGDDNQDDQLPPERAYSLGSGFIISSDGYVVTNNHVIDEANEITVTLSDGDSFPAEVIGRDPLSDIALLKIDAGHDLPFAKFGNSDTARVGEWVMTVGNPFGLGGTVTIGIVSAHHRDIGNGNYDDFIQTDASINRGNSGGPMFNMAGEVIGVNTMIFSPTGGNVGIGFAIPSNQVSVVVDQLKEYGRTRRGWIGVTIQPVTDEVAESLGLESTDGAIISSVVADGPSEKAGIQAGDIILEFNGDVIEDMRELPKVVAATPIDKKVAVVVLREGKRKTFSLVTGELETSGTLPESPAPQRPEQPREPQDRLLGMVLKPLAQADREQFEIPDTIAGVLIENLNRRSEAALAGIRPGDVIVQVNLKDVRTVRDVEEAITGARRQGRQNALLRIYRDGGYFHVPLPVGEEGEQ